MVSDPPSNPDFCSKLQLPCWTLISLSLESHLLFHSASREDGWLRRPFVFLRAGAVGLSQEGFSEDRACMSAWDRAQCVWVEEPQKVHASLGFHRVLPVCSPHLGGASPVSPPPCPTPFSPLNWTTVRSFTYPPPILPFLKALRIKVKFQPGTQDPVPSSTDLHSQPHHPLLQPQTLAPTILDNLPCQGPIGCSHSLPQFFYRSLAS